MKRNTIINKALVAAALFCAASPVWAQDVQPEAAVKRSVVKTTEGRSRKAWEIGVGGVMTNWNRVGVTSFKAAPDGYRYNLRSNHLMGGAQLYIARELNPWFYLDLQGNVSLAKAAEGADRKYDKLFMGGLGLQFRFTPLFKSKYVEPYLRVGVNYLHKDYDAVYRGGFADDVTGKGTWETTDVWNPDGRGKDKNSFIPLAFGVGVNSWFSDRFGFGLQGDYLLPVQKDLPHFVQVSGRLMWRIGGKSKRPAPVVEYVEVDRPVERVVVERVEVPVERQEVQKLYILIENINFAFDRDELTEASRQTLTDVAEALKQHSDTRILITGHTDAKGSAAYNEALSARRARMVYDALIKRGVPASALKWRGVGKKTATVSAGASDEVRRGDRKVVLEVVTNDAYWNALR